MLIMIYPIADDGHFLLSNIIVSIFICNLIYLLGKKYLTNSNKQIIKQIILAIKIFLLYNIIAIIILNYWNYIITDKNADIKHYKGIIIGEELKNQVNEIDKYILHEEEKGNKVYILDATAALYMLSIDKYNKNYDMFLKGNIGSGGEIAEIEKIKNEDENTIFLIRDKNIDNNWQTPFKVIKYIRTNLEQIGKIGIFEIYKIRNEV